MALDAFKAGNAPPTDRRTENRRRTDSGDDGSGSGGSGGSGGGGGGRGGVSGINRPMSRDEFERRVKERKYGRTESSDDDKRGDKSDDQPAATAATAAPQPNDDIRNVILVLSDGKDSGPIGFRQKFVSQAEIIERARNENVMIYAVGMRSRSGRPNTPNGVGPAALGQMLTQDLPDPGLARVAEETGGGYAEIKYGEDLAAAFARVADELHSQYLLGYAPPKRDGKVHAINVRLVTQGGMKARARKDYVAPKD
jgi:VWFA-related protein